MKQEAEYLIKNRPRFRGDVYYPSPPYSFRELWSFCGRIIAPSCHSEKKDNL